MKVYDAIVVGGGILGATTAAMLAQRGADVILLDKATCASAGASAYSGGIVRLYDADPVMMQLSAHALQVRSSGLVGTLFNSAIRASGVLYRTHEHELETIAARMSDFGRGYAHCILTHRQLAGVTGFVPPRRDRVDLFEPSGGHGDVRFTTHAMARLVRDRGAVLEHVDVRAVDVTETGEAVVRLAQGHRLRARTVVVAAGAWTGQLVDNLPIETRSIPLGLLDVARAPELPVIDIPAQTYAVPFGASLVGIGCGPRSSTEFPGDLPAMGEPHRAASLDRLAALTGQPAAGALVTVLSGFDSYTPDNRPVFGFPGDQRTLYVIAGLSGIGFKAAPAIADIAADAIWARLRDADVCDTGLSEAFHPNRFALRAQAPFRKTI